MKKISTLVTGISFISLSYSITCQAEDSYQLPNMTVTATKTPQVISDSLAPVNVFTRQDIERLQAQDLFDVLRHVPSVNITTTGGKGTVSKLFFRGSSDKQVLVLVDGIKINTATNGKASLSSIDINQVERIEVVRGPRSVLYGSEALAGVIHIFTQQYSEKPIEPTVKTGFGSHKSEQYLAGIKGKQADAYYGLKASYYTTEGFNRWYGDLSNENDGYRNKSFTGNIQYQLTDNSQLALQLMRQKAEAEYDNAYAISSPVYTTTTLETATARYSHQLTQQWDIAITAGLTTDKSDDRTDHIGRNFLYESKRQAFNWQNNLQLTSNQLLSFGLDYYDDHLTSTTHFDEDERDNHAWFIQDQLQFGKHEILIGFRQDDNEQFGKHNTRNLAWGMPINDTYKVTASYGEAFVAPSFNDLYYPNFSNPNLNPEQSKHYEVGLQADYGHTQWHINVFKTDIKDMIIFQNSRPENSEQAQIKGLELAINTLWQDWQINSNFTILDPIDKNTDTDSQAKEQTLPNRSRRQFSIMAHKTFGRYNLGIEWQGQSERKNIGSTDQTLPGYATVNVVQSYALTDELSIEWKINNLFDKDYVEDLNNNIPYETDGINTFISLTYRPNL
ncbi:TonB-dependent receptor domain-containing protein [Zooshikella sp. RANM57]|uniref:TonB-dependent receptor domain-containing protein n=1 Tax=Zooshikella sp. RANM57 TaxID=3425863 RepID=UPI003D6F6241